MLVHICRQPGMGLIYYCSVFELLTVVILCVVREIPVLHAVNLTQQFST